MRDERRSRQVTFRGRSRRRESLTAAQRSAVLRKTGCRCHICGGVIGGKWQADHVLAHSGGGKHSLDNYLAAHKICNGYRWDYSAEEFQWILKIGVWARTGMRKNSALGRAMAAAFFNHELRRQNRRGRARN